VRGTEARFRRSGRQGFDPHTPQGRTTRPPERPCRRAHGWPPSCSRVDPGPIYSANLARRQLTKSQLAMAGAKLKAWHAVRAKERMLAALEAGNRNRHGQSPAMEDLPQPAEEGAARDHAARWVQQQQPQRRMAADGGGCAGR
jgi:hypothetical protein